MPPRNKNQSRIRRPPVVVGLLLALVVIAPAHAQIICTDLYTLGKPYDIFNISTANYPPVIGGQFGGSGRGFATGDRDHALVWNVSAPNAININPTGFSQTRISGTSGTQHVGSGWSTAATGGQEHALIWNGNTTSIVDLHPAGAGRIPLYVGR